MVLEYGKKARLPNTWILEGPDGAGKSTLAKFIGAADDFGERPSINTPEGYEYDLKKLEAGNCALDRFYLISGMIYLHVKQHGTALTVPDIRRYLTEGATANWYTKALELCRKRKQKIRFCFLLPSGEQLRILPKSYKTAEQMDWLRENRELLINSYWAFSALLMSYGFEIFVLCDETITEKTEPDCYKQAITDILNCSESK